MGVTALTDRQQKHFLYGKSSPVLNERGSLLCGPILKSSIVYSFVSFI